MVTFLFVLNKIKQGCNGLVLFGFSDKKKPEFHRKSGKK